MRQLAGGRAAALAVARDDELEAPAPLRVAVVAELPATRARLASALGADGLALAGERASVEGLDGTVGELDAVTVAAGETEGAASAVRAVHALMPVTPVVVVWPDLRQGGVRRALGAGAAGLVLESQIETALAVTVRAACAGQVAVPREVRQSLGRPALGYREKQILGMVVIGYTNQEVARKLHLTESTVKSHLSSAFRKLGVRSRHEATALILDPDQGLGTGILAISGDEWPARHRVPRDRSASPPRAGSA